MKKILKGNCAVISRIRIAIDIYKKKIHSLMCSFKILQQHRPANAEGEAKTFPLHNPIVTFSHITNPYGSLSANL